MALDRKGVCDTVVSVDDNSQDFIQSIEDSGAKLALQGPRIGGEVETQQADAETPSPPLPPYDEKFVDDSGQNLWVHRRTQDCDLNGCCIHNPSDHSLRGARLVWRRAGPFDIKPSHMERICSHGVGHPDPDDTAWRKRTGRDTLSIHGCDGCCR